MKRIPFLILSDAVSASSGLARITRDLAWLIDSRIPELRVGTVGYGAAGSRRFPWQQYHSNPQDWVIRDLPEIWKDFAGEDRGIVMTIWDAARLMWFSLPKMCPDRRLGAWLNNAPFQRWAYLPIDAHGPNGKLSFPIRETILGFDRVLNYSKWSENVMRNSGIENTGALPHGIDKKAWCPTLDARGIFRRNYGLKEGVFIVGVVATNQPRKDFGLAVETAYLLREKHGKNVVLWIHTDQYERTWSLPTLMADYDFKQFIITGVDRELSDEELAVNYSACDVTLGIGLGEGFGYPIFESLACGTPCIHGEYGGAPEHMPKWMTVPPEMYRSEGLYACQRPVHSAEEWAYRIAQFETIDAPIELPPELDWENLDPRWIEWFKNGVKGF
jgi:glycosyltransferase involved in cell wall biosynthesis